MKQIILLIIILFSINTVAQQASEIECVYIERYRKDEIMHNKINEQKILNKESYEQMIDYFTESYYFTLSVDS